MCDWGNEVVLDVPIRGDLSITEEDRWGRKPIDECIAPLVDALNKAGVFTVTSCCGHGKLPGEIWLWDGRKLIIE